MNLKELDILIVEDMEGLNTELVNQLESSRILVKDRIFTATTYEEAEEKIHEFKKHNIKKLVLILDGKFPEKKWEKEHYLWRYLVEYISQEFWPEFILYLIPFSSERDQNNYMKRDTKDDKKIYILEWTTSKRIDDNVIQSIQSIRL